MFLPLGLLTTLVGCDNSAAEALLTCEGGNIEACFRDGNALINAARPQFGEARKKFAAACNVHHAPSCNELGKLVRDAKGGPKDLTRAVDLFSVACKGDIQTACVDLGELLFAGEIVKQDAARAVELFTSACNTVDPAKAPTEGAADPLARACNALGVAYRDGVGVEPPKKDEKKAAELFDKACSARLAAGCVSAGALAATTKRKDDVEKAAVYFETACKLDARQGCMELAGLHADKAWPGAADDKAALYYQKTCNIDPTRGCYEAGFLMETGRVPAREGEIEYLYNLACEHGHTEACSKRQLQ